jgi:hypothetical protein
MEWAALRMGCSVSSASPAYPSPSGPRRWGHVLGRLLEVIGPLAGAISRAAYDGNCSAAGSARLAKSASSVKASDSELT